VFVCVCVFHKRHGTVNLEKVKENINRCEVCSTATSCSEDIFKRLRMRGFCLRVFVGFS